jgi:hypothetical protein
MVNATGNATARIATTILVTGWASKRALRDRDDESGSGRVDMVFSLLFVHDELIISVLI